MVAESTRLRGVDSLPRAGPLRQSRFDARTHSLYCDMGDPKGVFAGGGEEAQAGEAVVEAGDE